MDLDGNVSHHGPSTVTTSSAPESGDTADTETENTSVTEAEAVDDSKIEEPSTDKADYGADSDRSNLSEGSVGDSLGSPVLNSTSPFNEADATESGTWINEPPLPRNEDGSDILLRPLHPENPQILRNETQGATTALQSDTDEPVNNTRERKNALSRHQTAGAKFGHGRHHRNRKFMINYTQPHQLPSASTHSKASMHDEATSTSPSRSEIDAAYPKALQHNGSPLASSTVTHRKERHDPDRLNYKIMLVKGTVAVVDLLTALVVGVVMRRRGSETLVVLTVDLLILTAGVVMLDAL